MIEIDTKTLREALERAKYGLAQKEIIEQSTCFCFDAEKGTVHTYSDAIGVSVPLAQDEITCAVPAAPLLTFMRMAADGKPCKVEFMEGKFRIKNGSRRAGIDAVAEIRDSFAKMLPSGKTRKLPFTMEEFATAFSACSFCVCNDMQRLTLCGLHIGSDEDGTYMEATDRWRIIRHYMTDAAADVDIIIPLEAARALAALGPRRWLLENGLLWFVCDGDVSFGCYQPDGKYPDNLRDMYLEQKKHKGKTIEFPPAAIENIELAAFFATQTNAADARLRIEAGDGKLRFSSKGIHGDSVSVVRCNTDVEASFVLPPATMAETLKLYTTVTVTKEFMLASNDKSWHLVVLDVEPETEEKDDR